MLRIFSYLAVVIFGSTAIFCSRCAADSLLVGFNALTPLQVYSMSGVYQEDFGPAGASNGFEENGLIWVVQPNTSTLGSSIVSAYNAGGQAVSSFTVPYLIGDGSPGQNGTLWLAGYNGVVYQYTTGGSFVSSFNTGYSSATSIGIGTDGTHLFTTEGDASDGIDERNASGQVLATVHTGYRGLYSLGWESTNATFFVGSFDDIYQLSLNFSQGTATVVNTFVVPGNSRTPSGAEHDGLAVIDLSGLTPSTPQDVNVATPEPGLGWLAGLAVLAGGLAAARRRKVAAAAVVIAAGSVAGVAPARAAINVSFTAPASTIPVGETLTFTVSAYDSANPGATYLYRYNLRATGAPVFSIIKDFYNWNTWNWTPHDHEGSYEAQVVVESSTGATASASQTIQVTSRVTGNSPVVNTTPLNTMVALYSAPACNAPVAVRVRFQAVGETTWQVTPTKTCDGLSLNFYIGGMRASTTYILQQDTLNGPFDTPGPQLRFTTGSVPSSFDAYNPFVIHPGQAPTNTSYPFELRCSNAPFATDLEERIVWYLPLNFGSGYMVRPAPGGTFLGIMDDQPGDAHFFREIDLSGHIIKETNWTVLNQEVNAYRAAHHQSPSTVRLDYISHEGYRMANGDTLMMVSEERVANQGQGNVDVLGDIILVLDSNFQVVWAWDSFDWLDITRKALQNNTCTPGQAGCPAVLFNKQSNGQTYAHANDWTHANSIAIDPSDGNIIISLRHQAWVIKVNYANGSGDGHVMWKLGNQGNFTLAAGTPTTEWFNYQHDAEFQSNGLLTLFDNNDLQVGADSRGQAWSLDQTHLVATPVVNVDLGAVSLALGSAQLLSNGNYWFGAGFLNNATETQSTEVTPSGTLVFRDESSHTTYRSFRLNSMYDE